ncbi:hypothetical protein [Mucilaginibacter pineti]|nr:hypothetical protein [Mucilaginibacter pineti]
MEPLYFKLSSAQKLMIIPDTLAHLDGHPVITQTYSLFKDTDTGNPLIARSKENSLHLEEINDPNYLGHIDFELPDKLFSYHPGKMSLENGELEQVIEFLSNHRDNPQKWN